MYWLELFTGPAALAGWGMVAVSILLFHKQRWSVATTLAATTSAIYCCTATPIAANVFVRMMEQAETEGPACGVPSANSVIVVLAGGMLGSPRSQFDYERLHAASLRRTIEGIRLARSADGSRLLLVGGSGDRVKEADLMRTMAMDFGIKDDRIFVERESRNTYQSAKAVARLLKTNLASDSVFLVTSAMHMRRAAATFSRQGIEFCTYPVDWQWMNPPFYTLLIPQVTALRKSSAALHEILGYVWYGLSGRL
jgi:uncharacterized SAM-binding protein YcdF (DUF218 family)